MEESDRKGMKKGVRVNDVRRKYEGKESELKEKKIMEKVGRERGKETEVSLRPQVEGSYFFYTAKERARGQQQKKV